MSPNLTKEIIGKTSARFEPATQRLLAYLLTDMCAELSHFVQWKQLIKCNFHRFLKKARHTMDSTNRDQSIAIVYQNQINLQTAIATSQVFPVEAFPSPAGKPREVTEIHIIKIKTEKNSSKSVFFKITTIGISIHAPTYYIFFSKFYEGLLNYIS